MAEEDPPASLALRETLDLWNVAAGGVSRGGVLLNKLQLSGTAQGDPIGLPGFSFHGQIFRVDGHSLSRRLGDLQTADNIDAAPVTRLFEAWAEKKFGGGDRSFAIRAGLMDLNADFDAIQIVGVSPVSEAGAMMQGQVPWHGDARSLMNEWRPLKCRSKTTQPKQAPGIQRLRGPGAKQDPAPFPNQQPHPEPEGPGTIVRRGLGKNHGKRLLLNH